MIAKSRPNQSGFEFCCSTFCSQTVRKIEMLCSLVIHEVILEHTRNRLIEKKERLWSEPNFFQQRSCFEICENGFQIWVPSHDQISRDLNFAVQLLARKR